MRDRNTSRVRLVDVAEHIERRMEGKSGTVTLHYKAGEGFKRVQYGDYEDADAMPTGGPKRAA